MAQLNNDFQAVSLLSPEGFKPDVFGSNSIREFNNNMLAADFTGITIFIFLMMKDGEIANTPVPKLYGKAASILKDEENVQFIAAECPDGSELCDQLANGKDAVIMYYWGKEGKVWKKPDNCYEMSWGSDADKKRTVRHIRGLSMLAAQTSGIANGNELFAKIVEAFKEV